MIIVSRYSLIHVFHLYFLYSIKVLLLSTLFSRGHVIQLLSSKNSTVWYKCIYLGTKDIFTCLKQLQGKLNAAEERDELSFLTSLFQNPQFQQAVSIHRKMISVTTQSPPPKPEATDAFETSNEVMEELQHAQSPYSSDLLEMLSTPGFRVSRNLHNSFYPSFFF